MCSWIRIRLCYCYYTNSTLPILIICLRRRGNIVFLSVKRICVCARTRLCVCVFVYVYLSNRYGQRNDFRFVLLCYNTWLSAMASHITTNQTSWRINYDVLLSRHTHAYWIAFIFIRKTITSMPHHEYFVSFYFKIINVLTFEIIDKLMTFYSLCEIYAQSVRSICIRRAFDAYFWYLFVDWSVNPNILNMKLVSLLCVASFPIVRNNKKTESRGLNTPNMIVIYGVIHAYPFATSNLEIVFFSKIC